MKTAQFGSVISGTMRPKDLIPTLASELRYLGHRSKALSRIERDSNKPEDHKYWNSDDCQYDLEILFDMLDDLTDTELEAQAEQRRRLETNTWNLATCLQTGTLADYQKV